MKISKNKIALGIEYNGSYYHGWEHQDNAHCIQTCIEFALTKVANEKIKVFCAGRTDIGVHATGQVIHFETSVFRKEISWIMGVNRYLPYDISVKWCKLVTSDFHARFSALTRQYHYIIFNNKYRPSLLNKLVTFFHVPLNEKNMNLAAKILVGEHDFTSFKSMQCQSKSTYRCIKYINVVRYEHYIIIDIIANAFMHHMVRNIVGSLIEIGIGKKKISWLKEVLLSKNRNEAAGTAKSHGLYLVNVTYPLKYNIPNNFISPLLYNLNNYN